MHTTPERSILKTPSRSTLESYKLSYVKGAEPKMTPFFMRWSYGVNSNVPAINLTTRSRKLVFYACAHAGIVYDYKHNDMRMLQGHKNEITSIAADDNGRWVVTADSGLDNAVIVWDTTTGVPILTLFNIHDEFAPKVVGLSRNSKYLITIGNEERPKIKFWLWTFGNQKPDDIYECNGVVGEVKNCAWNPNCAEHFVITFENNVIFGFWDVDKMKIYTPLYNKEHRGPLIQSTYLKQSHNVFSGTINGYILIWGNKLYACPYKECLPNDNDKKYIKAIKISDFAINVVIEENGYLVTGDADGKIRFYDNQVRILHYYDKFKFDSIIGISFNVERRCYIIKRTEDFLKMNPLRHHNGTFQSLNKALLLTDKTTERIITDIENTCDKNKDEPIPTITEVVFKNHVLSDETLDRNPFIVQDFLVFTSSGTMEMVHFTKGTRDPLTHTSKGIITAIVAHVSRNLLLMGNGFGQLSLFDMNTHLIIGDFVLPLINDEFHNQQPNNYSQYITCLTYSPEGYHLACGLKCGCLWMLDCSTLECVTEEPFSYAKEAILKICFSADDLFMAYYDASNKVCLMYYQQDEMTWKFIGKVRPHYKPITELIFSQENNADNVPGLFSLGADRLLVQYDVKNSLDIGNLILKSSERIEQTAVPLCAIWSPIKLIGHEKVLLAADDKYKFKYYNPANAMTHGTMLAPTFGKTPIQRMAVIPESMYSKARKLGKKRYLAFCNKHHIGIQILPPDGSPFKYTGMVGHPVELIDMTLSADGKYFITLGKNNTYAFQWFINVRATDVMERIGGVGLDPFYGLIEGGRDGWLFHEMEDLFYYMQIISQGENISVTRVISNKIQVSQLPDLMRAIGFYPTDYEVENMLIEVKYKDEQMVKEIDFTDFVKLYINHKPTFNVSMEELTQAFLQFAVVDKHFPDQITREQFIDILCELGERFPLAAVKKFLSILLHFQEVENDLSLENIEDVENFDFIPETITLKTLLEDILGIDVKTNFPNLFMDETFEPSSGAPSSSTSSV